MGPNVIKRRTTALNQTRPSTHLRYVVLAQLLLTPLYQDTWMLLVVDEIQVHKGDLQRFTIRHHSESDTATM